MTLKPKRSTRSIRLADLAGLSTVERDRRLSEVVADTRRPPAADDVAALDERIAAFEAQHSMSSEVMQRLLSVGEIRETYAVCQWLMALELRRRMPSPDGGQ